MNTFPKLGLSWSAAQAQELGLDPLNSFETTLQWPIEYVRLGVYWDQVEAQPDQFNFSSLEPYLKLCTKYQKQVILTVGMKAPRWPEFYFPEHLTSDPHDQNTKIKTLKFIQASVTAVSKYDCITTWQVENEPLDPSGPDGENIALEFLKQEVELVRSLDTRAVLLTAWGNNLKRQNLPQLAPLADVLGLDLYYKQHLATFLGKSVYTGPDTSEKQLIKILSNFEKPIWITELQAEPWEDTSEHYRSNNPGSMSLKQLRKNWTRACQLPVEVVLFWGVEYWLWQQQQGNDEYVHWIQTLNQK